MSSEAEKALGVRCGRKAPRIGGSNQCPNGLRPDLEIDTCRVRVREPTQADVVELGQLLSHWILGAHRSVEAARMLHGARPRPEVLFDRNHAHVGTSRQQM